MFDTCCITTFPAFFILFFTRSTMSQTKPLPRPLPPPSSSPPQTHNPLPNPGEELSELNHFDYLLMIQQAKFMPKLAGILPRNEAERALYREANFEGIKEGQKKFTAAQKKYLKVHGDPSQLQVCQAAYIFGKMVEQSNYLEKRGWRRFPTSRGWTEPKFVEEDYKCVKGCCGNTYYEDYPKMYFGCAFYLENDDQPLEIAIAHRSTEPTPQWFDDITVGMHGIPEGLLTEAAKYSQNLLKNKHFSWYQQSDFTIHGKSVHKITHVGHSLGAFIASALVAMKQNCYKLHAVVFDGMGPKECLELRGFFNPDSAKRIINYVAPPHLVNTCNTLVGTVYQLPDHVNPNDHRFKRYDWSQEPSIKLLRDNTPLHEPELFMIEQQEGYDVELGMKGALFRYPAFKEGEWKATNTLKDAAATIDFVFHYDELVQGAADEEARQNKELREEKQLMELAKGGEKIDLI